MATTVESVIAEIRNVVSDYGISQCSLTSAADADDTILYVDDASGFEAGWAGIDAEMVRVISVDKVSSPNELEVKRGQRGTAGATHVIDSNVYMAPMFSGTHVLSRLNAAVAYAYPKLYDVVSASYDTELADGQKIYPVPTGMDDIILVEIKVDQQGITNSGHLVWRDWQPYGDGYFQLFGIYDTSDTFRITGRARFAALTYAGNLPADLDTAARIQYLIMQTNVFLLMDQQALLARRDSLLGRSDGFGTNQPYVSGASAKELQRQADSLLASCRMASIPTYSLRGTRYYYQ